MGKEAGVEAGGGGGGDGIDWEATLKEEQGEVGGGDGGGAIMEGRGEGEESGDVGSRKEDEGEECESKRDTGDGEEGEEGDGGDGGDGGRALHEKRSSLLKIEEIAHDDVDMYEEDPLFSNTFGRHMEGVVAGNYIHIQAQAEQAAEEREGRRGRQRRQSRFSMLFSKNETSTLITLPQ